LLQEAGPNLRWSLRITADLLLERGVEGSAIELGEPCELIELPLIAVFDQGDLQRLAVEDLAGRRAVGRRSVAIDLDVGDLDRVSRGLCRLFLQVFSAAWPLPNEIWSTKCCVSTSVHAVGSPLVAAVSIAARIWSSS
jgi:hypothetical protein